MKLQWQDSYNNIKILRGNQQNNPMNPLQEISHNEGNKKEENLDIPILKER